MATVKSLRLTNNPSSITKRVFAYLIDTLIISLIVNTSFSSINKSLNNLNTANIKDIYQTLTSNPYLMNLIIIMGLVTAVLSILYWALLEYNFSQSIGKIIFNIEVKSLNKQLTFSQALLRNISKISTILLIIDCIPLLRNKNQRFSEVWSKTIIYDKIKVIKNV